MESVETQTLDAAAPTRAEWERWIEVANSALAEVGAEPPWDLNNGTVPATDGDSREHYRSTQLADLALGFDRRETLGGGFPAGLGACWPCWQTSNTPTCLGVTYEMAWIFMPCGKGRCT